MANPRGEGRRGRNTNAVRLSLHDGETCELAVRHFDSDLAPEQIEAARAECEKEQDRLRPARRTDWQQESRRDPAQERRITAPHTPEGWIPANHRDDHIDPFARKSDPRRNKK